MSKSSKSIILILRELFSFQLLNEALDSKHLPSLQSFNPIAFGILRLSQLRGGGGGFLSHIPENNVKIISIEIWYT